MERLTLKEFRVAFNRYFNGMEKNVKNLDNFFFMYNRRLPLFPQKNYIRASKELYDKITYGKNMKLKPEMKLVEIEHLYGDSWVFNNNHMDGRPLSDRLARLFLAKKPEDITPLAATEINENEYYTNDGNHRIYAAYLRGWKVRIYVDGNFKNNDLLERIS